MIRSIFKSVARAQSSVKEVYDRTYMLTADQGMDSMPVVNGSCSCSCGVVYQRFIAQFRLRSVGFTTSWVVCVTTRCKIISSEYESRKSKQSARHNQLSRYWLTNFIVNCTGSIQWHNQTSSQWCSQRGWKGKVDFHPLSNSGAHFH